MTLKTRRLIVVTVLLFLAAASAQAIFYTVTLKNGTTFETRYRPVQAEWDPSVSMLLTDRGNWIALRNDEIADVVSVFEESGFGYQLNTTTRFIGWSPNDLVNDESTDEDGNPIGEQRYDLEADQGAVTDYSIDQFLTLPTGGAYGNPTSGGEAIPVVDSGNGRYLGAIPEAVVIDVYLDASQELRREEHEV